MSFRAELDKLDDFSLQECARSLGQQLRAKGWRMGAAESCTGGWVTKVVTDLPGSSQWFECGVVTYSNTAKIGFLGVSEATLTTHGAVSEAVVREMTAGMLARSPVDLVVAISGIAGPDGGQPGRPVGTVCFALQAKGEAAAFVQMKHLPGDREQVRRRSVQVALEMCENYVRTGRV